MGPRSRGQSELIGIVLLIGVITTLFFGVGFVVLSEWQSQANDEKRVTVASTVTADNVTLEHQGGDPIDAADVRIVLGGDSEEEYALENTSQQRGDDEGRFEPGDRWVVSHSVSGDTVRLLVVHDPTNSVLHSETTGID